MNEKPFRWNLANRRALDAMFRTLGHGFLPEKDREVQEIFRMGSDQLASNRITYGIEHAGDVVQCCARILAAAPDCDLVFVGRSPETFFDHLSGALMDTEWSNRLTLLQFSYRLYKDAKVNWLRAIPAIRKYFREVGLDPASLARRPRPVAFVDLVYTGGTYSNLVQLLRDWTDEEGLDWNAIRRKIRLVGITPKRRASPTVFRWTENARWLSALESGAARSISLRPDLWAYFGDHQTKVTKSFAPFDWGHERAYVPIRDVHSLAALRLALFWFDLGLRSTTREELAAILCEQPEMKRRELRELVLQLRQIKKSDKRQRKSRSRSLPAGMR